MMSIARIQCLLLLIIALTSCEAIKERPRAATTAVAGLFKSEIGGSDKADTPVTAFGTLLGGYHQTKIGKSLVLSDRSIAEAAARKGLETLPDGELTRWSNAANGHSGTFRPVNSYYADDRFRCRDFIQSITIDGRTGRAYGTACLDDSGVWRIVEVPITRHRPR